MKLMKLAVAAIGVFAFGNASAFHDGGAAYCDGCHVMHNASSGQGVTTIGGVAARSNVTNAYLLQGSDQSSTCLICHSGPKLDQADFRVADLAAAGAPTNFTPGGDFGWLSKTFNFTYPTFYTFPSGAMTSPGDRKGHNVVAADFGLVADTLVKTAPGGSYTVGTGIAGFACSSCHDPHGQYRMQGTVAAPVIAGPSAVGTKINPISRSGSYGVPDTFDFTAQAVGTYRLLAGKGYAPKSNPTAPFPNDPPFAAAPLSKVDGVTPVYNQNEATQEIRVAYGKGMSEWCQNCHTNVHLDGYVTGAAGLRHPAGNGAVFRKAQADIYNSYVASGDLTGAPATSYSSLVPFEGGETNLATLRANASYDNSTSPVAVENKTTVMCLSCHRAHATGWDFMVRWNMTSTFLTVNGQYPGTDAPDADAARDEYSNGRSQADTQAAYYGRPATNFATFQRSLCNKCHAKD